MRRNGPTRHLFVEDPENTDPVDRRQWCARCNLPEGNAVHRVPESTVEQAEYERRKVGER